MLLISNDARTILTRSGAFSRLTPVVSITWEEVREVTPQVYARTIVHAEGEVSGAQIFNSCFGGDDVDINAAFSPWERDLGSSIRVVSGLVSTRRKKYRNFHSKDEE